MYTSQIKIPHCLCIHKSTRHPYHFGVGYKNIIHTKCSRIHYIHTLMKLCLILYCRIVFTCYCTCLIRAAFSSSVSTKFSFIYLESFPVASLCLQDSTLLYLKIVNFLTWNHWLIRITLAVE